jgi:hypothetical protein
MWSRGAYFNSLRRETEDETEILKDGETNSCCTKGGEILEKLSAYQGVQKSS